MRETEQAEKGRKFPRWKVLLSAVLWLACNPGELQEVINPKTAFYPSSAVFPCIENPQGILLDLLAESLATGKASSAMRITSEQGEWEGRIEVLFCSLADAGQVILTEPQYPRWWITPLPGALWTCIPEWRSLLTVSIPWMISEGICCLQDSLNQR